MAQPLATLVTQVAELLRQTQTRIVFAESCTGGLVSASLARVSGISQFLCGSAVVYRVNTKTDWLGVPEDLLLDPGPVSDSVARAMALGVLQRTPEASLAVSITGHLGPQAPPEQDGQVFIAIARRTAFIPDKEIITVFEERLPVAFPEFPLACGDTVREQRQWKAVERVLSRVLAELARD